MKAYFLLIIVLVLLSGCISQQPQISPEQSTSRDIKVECCNQCSYGASHDVRAFDIRIAPCSDYNNKKKFDEKGYATDENVVTPECAAYFEKTGLRVGECR